jgi:hypothetical protein
LPSVIVRVTLNMAGIILTAAGLGFLGLGAQPPWPEWGAMIATGREFMLDKWWVIAFPGIAICSSASPSTSLGDGLRDVLDPERFANDRTALLDIRKSPRQLRTWPAARARVRASPSRSAASGSASSANPARANRPSAARS